MIVEIGAQGGRIPAFVSRKKKKKKKAASSPSVAPEPLYPLPEPIPGLPIRAPAPSAPIFLPAISPGFSRPAMEMLEETKTDYMPLLIGGIALLVLIAILRKRK